MEFQIKGMLIVLPTLNPPLSDPGITTTHVQAFPLLGVMRPEFPVHSKSTGDLVVAEPHLEVSPLTDSRPVAEIKSQVIAGPSSDRREL